MVGVQWGRAREDRFVTLVYSVNHYPFEWRAVKTHLNVSQ